MSATEEEVPVLQEVEVWPTSVVGPQLQVEEVLELVDRPRPSGWSRYSRAGWRGGDEKVRSRWSPGQRRVGHHHRGRPTAAGAPAGGVYSVGGSRSSV